MHAIYIYIYMYTADFMDYFSSHAASHSHWGPFGIHPAHAVGIYICFMQLEYISATCSANVHLLHAVGIYICCMQFKYTPAACSWNIYLLHAVRVYTCGPQFSSLCSVHCCAFSSLCLFRTLPVSLGKGFSLFHLSQFHVEALFSERRRQLARFLRIDTEEFLLLLERRLHAVT